MLDRSQDNFIREAIDRDLAEGVYEVVRTRFPPEPNGRLHIGNAYAICIDFGIAADYGGFCHLRFDDTNPVTEETEHVEAIEEDIRWLGFDWGDHLYFASDYFPKLYEFAVELVRRGKAFVCDLTSEEILERRGSLTRPGAESPYRDRSVEENRDLFERMKAGEFEPGARTLRAKIDMASPVLPNRDPVLYRILKEPHHRTGTDWSIYPLYDFAHCLSDALENISHSLCSIEFVDHRPLYEWVLENSGASSTPRQIEFSRLYLSHTVLSKRYLTRMVDEGLVSGWDDARMPTLSGLRRRGYTPESIRRFSAGVGVTRRDKVIELARLEYEIREDLNKRAPRVMAVLDPLRVVIENHPDGEVDELDAVNNPEDPSAGSRKVPFSRVLYIERGDFLENPPKKFFRLAPGREVRLRYAYFITCTDVIKNEDGEIVELRCTYDPETRGGDAPDGRKVKGTLHWVSAEHSLPAEVRLYEPLFTVENPLDVPEGRDFTDHLNPDSLKVLRDCRVEPSLTGAAPGAHYQFERQGYVCVDPDSTADQLVFNRTVTLRDTWAKIAKQQAAGGGSR